MTKQYLLIVDEAGMEKLQKITGTNIEFLEVQGMGIAGNAQHTLLVAPIKQPVNNMMESATPIDTVKTDSAPVNN